MKKVIESLSHYCQNWMGSTSIVAKENVCMPYYEAQSGWVFDKFQHPTCKKLEDLCIYKAWVYFKTNGQCIRVTIMKKYMQFVIVYHILKYEGPMIDFENMKFVWIFES